MFIKLLFLVIGILSIAFVAIGFNIFFRNKKFPQTSVGKNKDMAKLGLSCAKHEEVKCRREIEKRTDVCSSCGCS
ncbi:MAG: hypothetical protein A2W99_12095 [Bacteroidetes bacterium GWF2_33_16]|nr:MAG: hypothetical protein A2X00_02180 [Bacteroidetes bacterium GWE2_32_14]OFY06439.1 MAG: hypothetical protein A2W99_12095 [Bacteroidetes bacterium GWF2_33_16]